MNPAKRIIISLTALVAMASAWNAADAQRRITPVQPRPGTLPTVKVEEPPLTDRSNLAERRDAQGNIVLVDTVSGVEWVDTTLVNRKPGMLYPKFESLSVGVDIWDPAMRVMGKNMAL